MCTLGNKFCLSPVGGSGAIGGGCWSGRFLTSREGWGGQLLSGAEILQGQHPWRGGIRRFGCGRGRNVAFSLCLAPMYLTSVSR